MPDLSTMPKAELHLHLEGSFRWPTLQAAFWHHYRQTVPSTVGWSAPGFRFRGFAEFLQLFQDYVDPWLSTPMGYQEILRDVVEGLYQQQVRYAEIDFSLGLVERIGQSLDQVFDWLEAEAEWARHQGMEIRFFAGLNRHLGVEQALRWTQRIRNVSVITGIDLHGSEVGWPAGRFESVFELARDSGKRVKVHAGEMVGPDGIWEAITQDITQIGHGTSAIHDPALVEVLRDRQILLEMCPTSNERLGNVPSYGEHPILALDQAGVIVTLNSDDSAFFGLNLTQEMTRLMVEREANVEDLKRWTRNAFQKADLDETVRKKFLLELTSWTPSETLVSTESSLG